MTKLLTFARSAFNEKLHSFHPIKLQLDMVLSVTWLGQLGSKLLSVITIQCCYVLVVDQQQISILNRRNNTVRKDLFEEFFFHHKICIIF